MSNANIFAEGAYKAYSDKAGGKTFDGKPSPTFEELGAERQACWVEAAKVVELMTLAATINLLTSTYNMVVSDTAEIATAVPSVQH